MLVIAAPTTSTPRRYATELNVSMHTEASTAPNGSPFSTGLERWSPERLSRGLDHSNHRVGAGFVVGDGVGEKFTPTGRHSHPLPSSRGWQCGSTGQPGCSKRAFDPHGSGIIVWATRPSLLAFVLTTTTLR